jgi:hypothetical protein
VAGRVSGPLPKGVLQQFEDDQVARGHQPLVGGQFRLQAIVSQSGHHFLGYPIDAFPEVRSCRIERQTVNVDGWRKLVGQVAKRVDEILAEFVDGGRFIGPDFVEWLPAAPTMPDSPTRSKDCRNEGLVPATGIGACAIFAPVAGSASSPLVGSGAFPQFWPSSKADCIVRCSCIKTG